MDTAARERLQEREQEIEAAQSYYHEQAMRAYEFNIERFDEVVTVLNEMHQALVQLILIKGSGRTRKPYVKRPGEQYARFVPGYGLVQFKMLGDGLVVRV